MSIFDIDGPLMRGVVKVFDCFLLSILWLLFSLPIVTCGAASAAMYTTAYKYLRKNEGTLWRTFISAFRENFKRSTAVWLISLALQALLAVDALVMRARYAAGAAMGWLYWVILLLICAALTWTAYLTAYGARFNGSARDVLKLSAQLMAVHPLRSAEVLIVILAELALIAAAPPLIGILPAVSCLLAGGVIEKVFLQHMSEEDVKRTLDKEDTL